MFHKITIVFLITILAGFITSAQEDRTYDKEIFIKDLDTLHYRILWPVDFSENKEYPVVLFLHGAGERGNDNEKQLTHGSDLFLNNEFSSEFPSILIFPQCPEDDYWSTVNIDRNKKGREKFNFSYTEKPTKSLSLVIDLMDTMVQKKYTKDNQIYIGGLSMGGMGTFEMLYRRPSMFAAAFPICGGGSPNAASAYSKKVALWVFHGAHDTVVDPTFSIEMVQAILKNGGFPRFTLYDFANHNSWDAAFAEPGLLHWLYAQKKEKNE
ncbi:dienelactone hydrolase family protein [Aquimarina addita]|uniref:Dienelactone hydrolase family protein n=1 Tax=Aquimarina addita TaxID=870485 RepID=A0ABP6UNM8_9FLAO